MSAQTTYIGQRLKVTLVANTAAQLFTGNARGARLLNWTASPVYIDIDSIAGTPVSGAPSDFIPAAAGGVPGQLETPYAISNGIRAVGASAGDITVITFE